MVLEKGGNSDAKSVGTVTDVGMFGTDSTFSGLFGIVGAEPPG